MNKNLLLPVILLSLSLVRDLRASDLPPGADHIDHSFSAICQVSIGAFGRRTAIMIKSSGSKALDDYIVKFAGESHPDSSVDKFTVPVGCGIVKLQTPHGKSEVTVAMPYPPYPHQARAHHEQGSGMVTVSFDESGRVVKAAMTPSTGSKVLDANTIDCVFKRWRSSGGEKTTIATAMTYRFE